MVKDTTGNYLLSGIINNKPITTETNNEIEYFLPVSKRNDKRASAKITKQIPKGI